MSNLDVKTLKSLSKAIARGNMRVAIAGTGGLAWWIAHHIHEDTGHQLLWLSRSVSLPSAQDAFRVSSPS